MRTLISTPVMVAFVVSALLAAPRASGRDVDGCDTTAIIRCPIGLGDYGDTTYRGTLALATLAVTAKDGRGLTTFRVLASGPLDTAVFMDCFHASVIPYPSRVPDSLLLHDWSQISGEFTDQWNTQWPFAVGDTLRDIFVLRETFGDGDVRWHMHLGKCTFLRGEPGPYPVGDALYAFNRYLGSNGMPKGYAPPDGDLRLGPLFVESYYVYGWELRAWSDSASWYLSHYVGGGDCPLGCTNGRTIVYRVDGARAVAPVDTTCFGSAGSPIDCYPNAVRCPPRSAPAAVGRTHGRSYALDGRELPRALVSGSRRGRLPLTTLLRGGTVAPQTTTGSLQGAASGRD